MTTSTLRTRLLASSMISGAALAAASAAVAQTAPPAAAAPAATVQELVVTGSRIPTPNLTSVSPVTTINNAAIKLAGSVNLEDLVNNLPQAFADFGQFESNGASGTATIDLRGLGNQRTLVLIDGKRIQPGDVGTADEVPDINFIPTPLIERVEVLTGGASAVYGSDAVAGVVNFIMKKDFEGLQIDAETSYGQHENNNAQVRAASATQLFGFPPITFPSGSVWTGRRDTVTITGGANSPDDKGNVEFYVSYTDIQPVLEAKYDWSTCGLATNTGNSVQYCGGSTTDATGRLLVESGPNKGGEFDIALPPAANGLLQPFSLGQAYNFAPINYIQRPDVRYNGGEFSHYAIAPWLDVYSSFMFMDDHTPAQIAASGSFFGDNIFTIPCNDPLLSVAQATTLCGPAPAGGYPAGAVANAAIGRRNVEGGGRVDDIEHVDYRAVIGAKGDIGDGWHYDVSMQYGKSILNDVISNYFLNSHLQNALDVIPGPNGPQCASGPPCVPYNLWTTGGVTPAALNYLYGTAIDKGYATEQVATGAVTGDLGQYGIKSPYAHDGVGISVGGEYRREFLSFSPDAAETGGDLAGFGGSLKFTQGSQSDRDVFGEIRVPLIQDAQFAKELTFEGGYRYSDYTSGGGNNTYKLGGDWQVTPDIRFRASYERAVRAPNVNELFGPRTPGLIPGTDPCAGATPKYSAAQCFNTILNTVPTETLAQFTGAAPGGAILYGQIPQTISGQAGDFTGGNPSLTPETGKTWSVGVVLTPTMLHGVSLSVDYFHILVDNAIVDLPFNVIMNGCALNDLGPDCALITRNLALSGAIYGGNGAGFVDTAKVNAGSFETTGVDVNADYHTSLSTFGVGDYGSVDLNFTGTYVDKLVTHFIGEDPYDCAGLYGLVCGTPTPKWRHQFRVSWITPWNLTLSGNWRYLSSTSLDFDTNQPSLQDNGLKDTLPTDAHIPTFNYFDVSFTYRIKDRYTVRGGINNIFDRTPPLLDTNSFGISSPPFGNANTYPQVFDPLGRVFFIGLTADF